MIVIPLSIKLFFLSHFFFFFENPSITLPTPSLLAVFCNDSPQSNCFTISSFFFLHWYNHFLSHFIHHNKTTWKTKLLHIIKPNKTFQRWHGCYIFEILASGLLQECCMYAAKLKQAHSSCNTTVNILNDMTVNIKVYVLM